MFTLTFVFGVDRLVEGRAFHRRVAVGNDEHGHVADGMDDLLQLLRDVLEIAGAVVFHAAEKRRDDRGLLAGFARIPDLHGEFPGAGFLVEGPQAKRIARLHLSVDAAADQVEDRRLRRVLQLFHVGRLVHDEQETLTGRARRKVAGRARVAGNGADRERDPEDQIQNGMRSHEFNGIEILPALARCNGGRRCRVR